MGRSRETHFCFVGQFLGYELKGYKIHRVHVRQGQEEYSLKVKRDARSFLIRASLGKRLNVGDWLEIAGIKKDDPSQGVKFTARFLSHTNQPKGEVQAFSGPSTSKMKVLVCQKSGCCKRGGGAVMAQLRKGVGDRNLNEQVFIQGTGCMGKCSSGPVVVIDKTHYQQVNSETVLHLVEHHLSV